MRARAHFSRSSRRWRWSLVCRANWRLSNVAAPYHARLRRHVRVRARRFHPAEIRLEHGAGSRAPAAHGRHDASSSTGRRAAGTTGGASLVSATDHRDLRDRPHSGHRHRAVAQSQRHQLARGGVGSGAESLNVAASIFMGQTEAPLTIRPFLPGMTRSELMTVMTAGMAHVSGSIMAAYIAMGIEARHLLTAVIMTAPGTIMMAKIIEPETETPQTLGGVRVEIPRTDVNIVDAAARGTTDGLHLMLNVIAMLVSFVALVALLNGAFGWVHGYVTWFPESIQTVLGWVFRPIAFAMGVPWHDSGTIGGLLGTRMVLNEFLAYAQLGPMRAQLDPVSFTIATFALCGFANISSVGIQIGGIGALVPDRKHDLARLGFRAMIAGTLANFLSATLAGMLL